MYKLKPCPCGAIPKKLYITESGNNFQYAYADGACCGVWTIVFDTAGHSPDIPECMELAVEAWNSAGRAG